MSNTLAEIDDAAAEVQRVLTALHELRALVINSSEDQLTASPASEFDKELDMATAGAGDHLDTGKSKFIELSESQEQLLALAEQGKNDINNNSRAQQIVAGIKEVLGKVISVAEGFLPALLG